MTDDRPLWRRELWPLPEPRPIVNGNGTPRPPGEAAAYAQAAFTDEVGKVLAAPYGERNDTLNTAAFNLGQFVGAGHLDRAVVEDALVDAGIRSGLTEREVCGTNGHGGTVASGLRAGELQPRQVPEPTGPGDVPEATVLSLPEQPAADDGLTHVDWPAAFADEVTEEWVVAPLIPARRLVALFSPAKTGKSLLMLELAVAISRGGPVLGVETERPRRVLYVDFENDVHGDVVPRLRAMGYGPDDLAELRYLSFPSLPYLDTVMGGLTLTAHCDRHGVEVVVIDTISRAVAGEENDNDTWLGFYRHTGVALKARGITCIRLDHTGKDLTKGMRGGSAKYGDVDAAWQMTPVTDDVLRLECVANRLPITEKVLMVERHADPLRHEVTTKRIGDVKRDQELELIDELDRLGVPRSAGRPTCLKALQEAGVQFSNNRLAEAVAKRKDGLHDVPELPELDLGSSTGPRTGPELYE